MKRTVLITGATSGIGLASAELFLRNDFRLVICGRRKEKLEQLRQSWFDINPDVETLSFDVRDKNAVFASMETLPENFKYIDILINNAGNAHGLDLIHEGDTKDWEDMIDINVKGLLYVSKAVLPGMVARRSGHIINIGSVAGKEVYPKGNVYCASKFAVDAISTGMRLDLNAYGVKVSEIKPGAVNTEFSAVRFKGDQKKAEKVYEGFTPLSAGDVADVIYFVATRPAHVNIADTLVLPTAQASAGMIHRSLG